MKKPFFFPPKGRLIISAFEYVEYLNIRFQFSYNYICAKQNDKFKKDGPLVTHLMLPKILSTIGGTPIWPLVDGLDERKLYGKAGLLG